MSKRFVETQIWSDPWYSELHLKEKLLWRYVIENCDNAGVWTPNHKLAEFQLGTAIDWSKALVALKKNVVLLTSGKWWVPSFIAFQFGKLSPDAKVHQSVIRCLDNHGLRALYSNWLTKKPPDPTDKPESQWDSNGIAIPLGTGKEKGKGKEPEGVQGEVETPLLPMVLPSWRMLAAFSASAPFLAKWERWQAVRRAQGKKPKDWNAMFQEQLDLLCEYSIDTATEILGASIRNNWQGLHRPKGPVSPAFVAKPTRQLSSFEIERRLTAITDGLNAIGRDTKKFRVEAYTETVGGHLMERTRKVYAPEAQVEIDRLKAKRAELKTALTQ